MYKFSCKGLLAVCIAIALCSSQGCATTSENSASAACLTTCVATTYVQAGDVKYAYRAIGPETGAPLIMINRFRGTMDDWDPAFIDALAHSRRVILFDNVGVARTQGEAPQHLKGWADNTERFIRALGYDNADLFGFSFGGLVAQELAYSRPALVGKMIIAGSGAGYVEGANVRPEAIAVATRPVNTDADFLYLFFRNTPTSQTAGRAYIARLQKRTDAFQERVSESGWRAMLAASADVSTPSGSLLLRAPKYEKPVLVANGVEDVMIPTFQSFALTQALPNAKLMIYPDSGHAFMFQYPNEFAAEVLEFLED